jgi:2-amino-4-hydroxy-6-hydroxymethyldihydropteridine diphosphokinase
LFWQTHCVTMSAAKMAHPVSLSRRPGFDASMQPPSQAPLRYHTAFDPATETSLGGHGVAKGSMGGAHSVDAFVALGANLGDPALTLARALAWLAALPETELMAVSSLVRTPPLGPPQPDYLNGVAQLRTRLVPRMLHRALCRLEAAAGRARQLRWGPRTLDLDLLVYGDVVLDTPELTLPHPRMLERAFVLEPLCELQPELLHPRSRRSMRAHLGALRGRSGLL